MSNRPTSAPLEASVPYLLYTKRAAMSSAVRSRRTKDAGRDARFQEKTFDSMLNFQSLRFGAAIGYVLVSCTCGVCETQARGIQGSLLLRSKLMVATSSPL